MTPLFVRLRSWRLGSGVSLIVIVAIDQVWSSTEDTIDGEAILGSEGWAGTRGSC